MPLPENPELLLPLTAQIVAAFVGHNPTELEAVPDLIRAVHISLAERAAPAVERDRDDPAVPISRSIRPDFIVCLEDGKRMKTLKRYLKTAYAMTPEQYRTRWHLPADYPMTAPNYAKVRSGIAKEIGLGRRPRGRSEPAAARA